MSINWDADPTDEVKSVIKTWALRDSNRGASSVLLLDSAIHRFSEPCWVFTYFKELAKGAGIDFFAEIVEANTTQDEETPVVGEWKAASVPIHRRWEINGSA